MAKRKKNYGYYLNIVGNVLAWVAILVYFIVIPLYFKNGYETIATRKYRCFLTISKYVAMILGTFAVVYFSTWGIDSREIKMFRPLRGINIGLLIFLLTLLISHFASPYRYVSEKDEYGIYEGTFFGTRGWYMGLLLLSVVILLCFFLAGFFKYSGYVFVPIMAVCVFICIWACLNRFGIYPIEMKYSGSMMLATVGNGNWYAGYLSVLVPIITGYFWGMKDFAKRKWMALPMFIMDAAVLLNGSDSIVVAMAAVLFVLLVVSAKDEGRLKAFSETLLIFCTAGMFTALLDLLFPLKRTYEAGLARVFGKSVVGIVIFSFALLLFVYMYFVKKNYVVYPKVLKNNLSEILSLSAAVIVFFYIVILILNTVAEGRMINHPYFLFSGEYASSRGATWSAGWIVYRDLPFINKIIGTGPDTFYFALQNNPTASALSYEYFNGARLTNAHNEIITLLVNTGLLGVAGFLTVFICFIRKSLMLAKENPIMIAFALSAICYLVNNIFSFEQIINIPFMFMTLGIGSAAIVSAKKC